MIYSRQRKIESCDLVIQNPKPWNLSEKKKLHRSLLYLFSELQWQNMSAIRRWSPPKMSVSICEFQHLNPFIRCVSDALSRTSPLGFLLPIFRSKITSTAFKATIDKRVNDWPDTLIVCYRIDNICGSFFRASKMVALLRKTTITLIWFEFSRMKTVNAPLTHHNKKALENEVIALYW